MNFHVASQIIFSAIAATSVMTLFSYVVSESARELYKEPVLLTYLLSSFKIEVSAPTKVFLGWFLHYIIGIAFVIVYHLLWFYDIAEISWLAAFLFGAISGVIGILGWILLFEITPKKPNIDFDGYYKQLFAAHIIFGLVAFVVYKFYA
jgi:hypothetical protein